ncbi:hypothetical protein [Noviherbaspirillum aridicola]|uniref:EF-hand domain-containing protein n=1 Tax=Noviherbaspirillum aridicola TaxID=2849687 RepID=A0ABQ4PZV6_9BURK|nr:hypothetical protein [Noviherbaspirillum aridicola]GIZ50431.1 hypothetical protein NCCP691_04450 [Noviherbaspirillum aridicola]
MKSTLFAVLAAAALSTACGSMHGHRDMQARHHGAGYGGHGGMMAGMDVNRDGKLSREEFMRAHEAMFDRMKGPDGMISLRDMPMHGQGMPGPGPGMGPGPAAGPR